MSCNILYFKNEIFALQAKVPGFSLLCYILWLLVSDALHANDFTVPGQSKSFKSGHVCATMQRKNYKRMKPRECQQIDNLRALLS